MLSIRSATLSMTVLLAFGLTLPATAAADTYQWTDANGVVNYSERKPRDVPASAITVIKDRSQRASAAPGPSNVVSSAPAPRPASGATTGSEPSDLQQNLSEEQQSMLENLKTAEAQRQEQVAKIRADNCERSRRVLSNLTAMGRIRVNTEEGAQRVMTEEERNQRIEEAQQGIATNCDA